MATAILTELKEWKELQNHYSVMKDAHMRDLFGAGAERGPAFTFEREGIYFDYSKNIITAETMQLLLRLAEACNVEEERERMFRGEHINETEDRAVLHVALRDLSGQPVFADGKNIMRDIEDVRDQMRDFSEKVRSGRWKGFSGKPVKNIVNIGIGGSDLGPVMVTEALKYYSSRDLNCFFVSNVDATHIVEVLKKIKADETLFIIASKTFTTQETMTNAETAKRWFLEHGGTKDSISLHFIALSTNIAAVTAFGIAPVNMFRFWDWVGGHRPQYYARSGVR